MATEVTCPMVGKIVKVDVKVGDKVGEDDQVAILEAMKMEQPITAHRDGVVSGLEVAPGETLSSGAVIASIEEAK